MVWMGVAIMLSSEIGEAIRLVMTQVGVGVGLWVWMSVSVRQRGHWQQTTVHYFCVCPHR